MPKHLTELFDYATIVPSVNQIEYHPYWVDRHNEASVIMATANPLTDRKKCEICKCHFLASLAHRPKIFSNWIPIRKNLGTIGLTRPKVAFFMFCVFRLSSCGGSVRVAIIICSHNCSDAIVAKFLNTVAPANQ